jgi:DnaJ family protein C protein 28
MDFKDWRHSATRPATEAEIAAKNKFHGRRYSDYIEEQLQEAQERGVFDNLPGMGQPLKLDVNPYAGTKALGYSLLKGNGYAPPEVELAREIRQELERLDKQRQTLSKRGQMLRQRRVPPFASEKRAYNHAVTEALRACEVKVEELNRKILTLNLSTPAALHRVPLQSEQMVEQLRSACPLLV